MRWGVWPFGSRFYSICSKHQAHRDDCDLCQHGTWHSDIGIMFSNALYRTSPTLWMMWANRKKRL